MSSMDYDGYLSEEDLLDQLRVVEVLVDDIRHLVAEFEESLISSTLLLSGNYSEEELIAATQKSAELLDTIKQKLDL